MMVPGPVRSGRVLEVPQDLVIIGDVNPGAEVCAGGNIVVLGKLRGIAHAGADGSERFIIALDLQPQQLRIASLIARADESERKKARGPEIAYAVSGSIIVEDYHGRLPREVAAVTF